MSAKNQFDLIIVGVGSMGAATAYYLSKQGLKVLGIEQFDIVHERGSHGGQSRIIRKAYFEHPDYVPLMHKAYENWKQIESESNTKLYTETGIVYFGKEFDPLIAGAQQSAALYELNVKRYNANDAREKFPAFKIPDDFIALAEPEAGFIIPDKTIKVYAAQAQKNGAIFLTNTKVKEWKQHKDVIEITTNQDTYTSNKLVITAGAWTKKIVPVLKPDIQVTQQVVAWVKPKNIDKFKLGSFPCWLIQDPKKGSFYGFPILPSSTYGQPEGLKIAHHFPGEPVDPDRPDNAINTERIEDIKFMLQKYFDEAEAEIVELKTCLYASTTDEDFIIDFLPDSNKKVVIACGFSGHGFKFAPVVGEILADMSIKGNTDLPINFLKLDRFRVH